MEVIIYDGTKRDLETILDIYKDQILRGTATVHTKSQTIDEVEWLAGLPVRTKLGDRSPQMERHRRDAYSRV